MVSGLSRINAKPIMGTGGTNPDQTTKLIILSLSPFKAALSEAILAIIFEAAQKQGAANISMKAETGTLLMLSPVEAVAISIRPAADIINPDICFVIYFYL